MGQGIGRGKAGGQATKASWYIKHTQPWKWAAPGRQERNSLKGEGMADRLRFHNPGFAIQKGIRDTKESHEYEYGREEREAGGK